MKAKILSINLLLLLFSLAIQAQTIVSTSPENKNVVLEEFTGIRCVYCPQGHAIAQSIKNSAPDDVFLINVHAGGYAVASEGEPDFTTDFGEALANLSNLAGYPAGTVNRHEFPGLSQNSEGGTALGRTEWEDASNQILAQSSYVNIATEAEVDMETRELTVLVEAYYTGDSPEPTNKLNLALLQNNTKGPQIGGNQGDNYNHVHRLVYFLTGQWGQDITTTTEGSFISQTFTYSIPEDYNGVPVALGELEVVAYIAEGNQEIITGNGNEVIVNTPYTDEVELLSMKEIQNTCMTTPLSPKITIYNLGSNAITSLDISFNINNQGENSYTWSGNLGLGQITEIELPQTDYNIQENNIVNVSLPNNDELESNNQLSTSFDISTEGSTEITINIRTDYFPEEMTWEIINSAGDVVASDGPYNDQEFETISQDITLPETDCYSINLIDSYGDGWFGYNSQTPTETPPSGVDIYSQGDLIYSMNAGNFGSSQLIEGAFRANSTLAVNEIKNPESFIKLYPNPSNGHISISNLNNFNIEVFNISGKLLTSKKAIKENTSIDLSFLSDGIYIINAYNNESNKTFKLIIE